MGRLIGRRSRGGAIPSSADDDRIGERGVPNGLPDPVCVICSSSEIPLFDFRRRNAGFCHIWRGYTVKTFEGLKIFKQVMCSRCLFVSTRIGYGGSESHGSLVSAGYGPVAQRPILDPGQGPKSPHNEVARLWSMYANQVEESVANSTTDKESRAKLLYDALQAHLGRLREFANEDGDLPFFRTATRAGGTKPPRLCYAPFNEYTLYFERKRGFQARQPYKKTKLKAAATKMMSSSGGGGGGGGGGSGTTPDSTSSSLAELTTIATLNPKTRLMSTKRDVKRSKRQRTLTSTDSRHM